MSIFSITGNKTVPLHIRHLRIALWSIYKGNSFVNQKYAELRALKSVQTFCENAPQVVLQTYVVIVTWKGFGKEIPRARVQKFCTGRPCSRLTAHLFSES